jgi:hypothetical protein
MRLFTLAILLVEISVAHGKNWWPGVFRRFQTQCLQVPGMGVWGAGGRIHPNPSFPV